MQTIKKAIEYKIPIKYILAGIATLVIILYFFKGQEFFEQIILMIIGFLIGGAIKTSLLLAGFFA